IRDRNVTGVQTCALPIFKSNIFLDCTGDGELGVSARAPFYEGRESKEMFGEDLAQENADNKSLGSSLMFQARKHDRPMPFTPPRSDERRVGRGGRYRHTQ